jgi:hypothetical protein
MEETEKANAFRRAAMQAVENAAISLAVQNAER